VTAISSSKRERIVGLDVARALAIWGMIVVHFAIAGATPTATSPNWLGRVVHQYLDGRAAATFMVLSGIGLTLLSRRAVTSGREVEILRVQQMIVRRGWFLLIAGFLNLAIWPGDILRIYGVTLIIAASFIDTSDRRLLVAAGGFVVGFLALFATFDYEAHWDWDSMTYFDLWTFEGVLRNLFYDGFRSVFPWSAFLFFGMWLGRRDLRDRTRCRRLLWISLIATVVAEVVSRQTVSLLTDGAGVRPEEADYLFGTVSMPPLPLFLVSACGTATAVIASCLLATGNEFTRTLLQPLAATGQMALTWYVLHITVGLGVLDAFGLDETMSLPAAVALGCGVFGGIVLVSKLWLRRSASGPFERLMRNLTD